MLPQSITTTITVSYFFLRILLLWIDVEYPIIHQCSIYKKKKQKNNNMNDETWYYTEGIQAPYDIGREKPDMTSGRMIRFLNEIPEESCRDASRVMVDLFIYKSSYMAHGCFGFWIQMNKGSGKARVVIHHRKYLGSSRVYAMCKSFKNSDEYNKGLEALHICIGDPLESEHTKNKRRLKLIAELEEEQKAIEKQIERLRLECSKQELD
jgi:hypothetical protein